MTDDEMKKALGVLVDRLADVAFDCGEIDGADALELLEKAGLVDKRLATQEDLDGNDLEYDMDVGDDWFALTPFASECRKGAQ